jgi:hypothetical protein
MQQKVNNKEHMRCKICSRSSTPQRCLHLHWGVHRGSGLFEPPELPPRSTRFSTKNPHEEEGDTDFSGLNQKLVSSWATPSCLGDRLPKSNKPNQGCQWWSSLARIRWLTQGELKSSLKNNGWGLEDWESVGELKFWILKCFSVGRSGQKGEGGGDPLLESLEGICPLGC